MKRKIFLFSVVGFIVGYFLIFLEQKIDIGLLPANAQDTFAGDGIVISSGSVLEDIEERNGFLYISGYGPRLEKRSSYDGSEDSSFSPSPPVGFSYIDISIDSSGQFIYVVGSKYVNPTSFGCANNAGTISKRDVTTGALISSFNSTGPEPGSLTIDNNVGSFTNIETDGSFMYLVGTTDYTGFEGFFCKGSHAFIEKRTLDTGAPAYGFGRIDLPLIRLRALNLHPTKDYFIAVGARYTSGIEAGNQPTSWYIEKRSKSNSNLLRPAVFGTAGYASGVKIDPARGSFYVIGQQYTSTNPGPSRFRIEKRNLADLSLSTGGTFGAGQGYVAGSDTDIILADFIIDSAGGYMYIVGSKKEAGGTSSGANYDIYIARRSLDTGDIAPGWGEDGSGVIIIGDPGKDERGRSITRDNNYLYIASHLDTDGDTLPDSWQIEKRRIADGRLAGSPVCGDGVIEGLEECDDGNLINGDGCSSSCTIETGPVCGNGVLETGEECDDGNTQDGDGCSSTCTIEAVCGNGALDAGEECDDGNTINGDGCSVFCKIESGIKRPVVGWAWSSNIGWVSFSGIARDGSPYGVYVDIADGSFSGYAWSENIGWLSFERSTACDPPFLDISNPGDPTVPCDGSGPLAAYDFSSSPPVVHGWARFLSYGNGWDGWVRFSGGIRPPDAPPPPQPPPPSYNYANRRCTCDQSDPRYCDKSKQWNDCVIPMK